MWSLGGLSGRELLKRTARESWEDDVFGQAGRLAFYHFIALFPLLYLLMMPVARLAAAGAGMRQLLGGSMFRFLPQGAAGLVTGAIQDLYANAQAGGGLLAMATGSAVWAGINASWAMIVALNTAYETREDRNWRELARAAAGLALAVWVLALAALAAVYYASGLLPMPGRSALLQAAQWAAIAGVVLISFALFYRFGPNLRQREWQWSTPGAVFGTLLWIGATLLAREYFNRFSSYHRIYGPAEPAAVLLVWLYITGATVLIGAEMNSEIEKAGEQSGAEGPERVRRRRRGERQPGRG